MKLRDIFPITVVIVWLAVSTSRVQVEGQEYSPNKIINGSNAEEFEFPFFLRLTKDPKKGKSHCGATIISAYYALTAAHCLVTETGSKTGVFLPVSTDNLLLEAGTASDYPVPEYTYKRKVQRYKMHPLYNRNVSSANDIAVLKVEVPFLLTELFSEAIKLDLEPTPTAAFTNGNAMIVGWGFIGSEGFNNSEPSQLQKASVLLRPPKYCETEYPTGIHKFDRNTMICSGGGFYSFSGGCGGDSGGPMIFNKMQIGVTSYGDPLCRLYKTSAYTKVSAFSDWIRKSTDIDY